ncbi:hypothetical protein [Streptomyces sp. NPDC005046]
MGAELILGLRGAGDAGGVLSEGLGAGAGQAARAAEQDGDRAGVALGAEVLAAGADGEVRVASPLTSQAAMAEPK